MITINRDNYDTWLMLYLDNELSATERAAVEAFAGMHPDVQEELNGLKETILQPEAPAAMPGIERLLMPEVWNEDALTGQQEQLLLLADNELLPDAKAVLESEMERNPFLQKEWSLLQKTIIKEAIAGEMPGKEKLYRREPSKVIPIGRILRFAAAAAVFGFGWFYINNLTADLSTNPGSKVAAVAPGEEIQKYPIEKKITETNAGTEPSEENIAGTFVTDKGNNIDREKARGIDAVMTVSTAQKDYELVQQGIPDVDKQEVISQKIQQERDVILPAITYVDIAGIEDPAEPAITSPATIEIAAYTEPSQNTAPYELVDAEDLEEDETINIAGARINKQKVRNVYRNITRPIARSFEKNNILK